MAGNRKFIITSKLNIEVGAYAYVSHGAWAETSYFFQSQKRPRRDPETGVGPVPGMTLHLSAKAQRYLAKAMTIMLSPSRCTSELEWHTGILNAVMPITNAYKAAIRVRDGDSFRMTPFGFEESAIREHQEYYHRFDFGRALGGSPVNKRVFSRNAYYQDFSRLTRSEYYADYLSKYRVFDALCISSRKRNHERGMVLYLWHEKEMDETWRANSIGALRLLAPAFRSGSVAWQSASLLNRAFGSSIDEEQDGRAIFSKAGRLLHCNAALTAILASRETPELAEAIDRCQHDARAIMFGPNESQNGRHLSSIELDLAENAYRISAFALEGGDQPHSSAIAVLVRRHQPELPRQVQSIVSRFNLTRRETQVACLLGHRVTNRELSNRIGVSEHTARHHTENVMRKLGVRHRGDISMLINAGKDLK